MNIILQACFIIWIFFTTGQSVINAEHYHDLERSRCGTNDPSPTQLKEITGNLQANFRAFEGIPNRRLCINCITIKTFFHIITSDPDAGLSTTAVQSQMDVLNSAFNETPFQFTLISATTHTYSRWALQPEFYDYEISASLRDGDNKTLNVFWANYANFTGRSWFPFWPIGGPEDKVRVAIGTQPGGIAPYDEGETLVHEIGHWLGLLHVFGHGTDPCSASDSGDFITDTPPQKESTSDCPLGAPLPIVDTCPDLDGIDSISNYMSYSNDNCLHHFTLEQVNRMYIMWTTFRDPPPKTPMPTRKPTRKQTRRPTTKFTARPTRKPTVR